MNPCELITSWKLTDSFSSPLDSSMYRSKSEQTTPVALDKKRRFTLLGSGYVTSEIKWLDSFSRSPKEGLNRSVSTMHIVSFQKQIHLTDRVRLYPDLRTHRVFAKRRKRMWNPITVRSFYRKMLIPYN